MLDKTRVTLHSSNMNDIRLYWEKYGVQFGETETMSTTDESRFTGRHYQRTLATLFTFFGDDLGSARIMDLGCGTGRLAKGIVDRCASMVLFDVAAIMIEQCRENFSDRENVEYVLHKGGPLPFPDRSIDFTYSYATMVYAATAQEYWDWVAEVDRVSRNFCIHMHCGYNMNPDPEKSIEKGYDIFTGEFYRPTPHIVLKRYTHPCYKIVMAEPDIRGLEPFFFKDTKSIKA